MQGYRKLTMICCAAVLSLGLAACGSGSDNGGTAMVEPEPAPAPAPDPEPTDLETTQMAAAAAAADAMTAATSADAAATGAEEATANIAAVQTNAAAMSAAMAARKYADAAMDAYMDAKAASAAAEAATTGDEAEDAWRDAVDAKEAAEAAATTAGEKAMAATEAAKVEVMVDGTTKSVGDTSITIDGKKVTSGTGPNMVVTGKQDDDLSAMSKMVAAVDAVAAVEDTAATIDIDETKAAVAAKPAVASRPIDIGVVYDSPDDSARVRLATSYIGSGTVAGIYFGPGTEVTGGIPQANHAAYDHDNDAATPAVRILKASGTFYESETAVDATGSVASDTKGVPLYYYDVVTRNGEGAVTGRNRVWLRRTSTTTSTAAGGAETVTHAYNSYGDGTGPATAVATTLKNFPMAMAFQHLHYGVWNSLNEKGTAIADMGIGFVSATADGGGMTGDDLPNAGDAEYNGQWIASVRGSGGGAITAQSGDTVMTADFDKDTIKVVLEELATLEGKLSGNTFSGTKVTGVMSGKGDLEVSADGSKFMGSFSGGFYGAKAAEAGGVFDYTSTDMAAGEFRGAFGGAKKSE